MYKKYLHASNPILESANGNSRNKLVNVAISAIKETLKLSKYKKYSKIIKVGLQKQYSDSNKSFISGESDEILIAEFLDTYDSVIIYDIPRDANKIFNNREYEIVGFEYCFTLVKKRKSIFN